MEQCIFCQGEIDTARGICRSCGRAPSAKVGVAVLTAASAPTIRCPKCGQDAPGGARFCPTCGQPFANAAPSAPAIPGAANNGVYEFIDTFAKPPARTETAASPAPPFTFLPEQHLLQEVPVITDDGTGSSSSTGVLPVIVPPLHHQVVTATLKVDSSARALQQAQAQLELAIQTLEQTYPQTPGGLGITVAWGLPYFQRYIPRLGKSSYHFAAGTAYPDYLPIDHRASKAAGKTVRAILDAIIFPSDQPPPGFWGVLLEANEVAVLLRSDSPAHIQAGMDALFGTKSGQAGWLFQVTSIRRGFAGGGFYGKQGLPSQMARAARIPGAEYIPPTAELFMGFTSTQHNALGPGVIANMESLPGLTDQWPYGYFQHGTTMHLSHLFEDLQAWYAGNGSINFSSYADRVRASFRPGLTVPPGTQTVPEGPAQVVSAATLVKELKTYGTVGHSASIQPATRLPEDVTDNYDNFYRAGTAIPQRADFNTLDNPFFYSANPQQDRYSSEPAAGLHFVVFVPTSDAFHRGRMAMDGRYPDGTALKLNPRAVGMGFNAVLTTTHRQNFLVPPRAHRSFPLAEYLL